GGEGRWGGGLSVAGCSGARPPMRSAGNRGGCHYHAACSRRAASSKPALWPLIIVPVVLPRIVVLAAAPEPIVETPTIPAQSEVVTARDGDIGRARAGDDAALRLVVQRNDELRAIIGLAVQRLVRNDERGPR